MESTSPDQQALSVPAERALSIACTQMQQPASEELEKLRAENARLKKDVRRLTARSNELSFHLHQEHSWSDSQGQKLAVMRLKLQAARASLHNLAAMATEQAASLERGGLLDGR